MVDLECDSGCGMDKIDIQSDYKPPCKAVVAMLDLTCNWLSLPPKATADEEYR